jgi:hypothetical protein
MYFLKWVLSLLLWTIAILIIPGFIASILIYPVKLGISSLTPLVNKEGRIFLMMLSGIYGFLFLLTGYYICIYYSEKAISFILGQPHLNPSHSLAIKDLVADIINNVKVRNRFIACNLIFICWAGVSMLINDVQPPGVQFMLFFTYYLLSLFVVISTVIYFSSSLRTGKS